MNVPNLKEARIRTKNPVKYIYNQSKIDDKLKIGEKTFYIKTYGCQMNEHDSENIKAMLEEMNFKPSDNMEDADIIILNTCAIRENAHNKVFGMLGRIKHMKEERNIITCLCGCMAQEEGVVDEIRKKYKWIDIVFGTHNIHEFPDMLYNTIKNNEKQIDVYSMEGNVIENLKYSRDNKYKAWVNIMYGCDKFCTYCIVPFTRGKQRSRKKEDILEEIKTLISEGVMEITLLGQNVNAYGKDLYDDYTMENLLEDVAKTNIPRIRFITSHPWDFTNNMIDVIAKYDNIMPFIHLPVQSGSNEILKKMGRRYSKEDYINLFNKIKEKIKDVTITTDIIVGFPNESKEDFEETLKLVDYCKFDLAYTFIYSKREGTPAAVIKDKILLSEKKKRLSELNKHINYYALENNKKLIGKTLKVLIEDVNKKDDKLLSGYTEGQKLVNVIGDKSYIGKIVDVEITDAKTWSLNGIIHK